MGCVSCSFAGLNGDSSRNKFGEIIDLIPIAELITQLHALCIKCKNGNHATFSKRICSKSKSQILVGTDEYIPVCRYHFLN